ncbi:bifunctional DNA primase/polymerase [Streptomyces inhibens]|uniref:bifunctional DNA primase/polymerase n=1 Tax=Streptomyces inhibens TaxID=2293571 RepID=UPI00402A94FB
MHQNSPRPLARAAFEAVDRGWYVFPLVAEGKRPAIRSWEQRAKDDIRSIARCWAAGDYNLGIAAGLSGLVVVDLDVPKHDKDVPPTGTHPNVTGGADTFALLAKQHGQRLPIETYTVRTASGGTHLYFAAPTDIELRNTAGTVGWKIDTRANGGYVVGAGSSIAGKSYTVVCGAPPLQLPGWLTKLLVPSPLPPQSPVLVPLLVNDRHSAYLRAAVSGELERVTRAHNGNRNNALYQASVALGQLVAGGDLKASEVSDWLTGAAVRAGLTEPEARRTIASGQRAGAKKPRSVVRRTAA